MPWYPGARRHDVRRDRGYSGRGSARPITPIGINHHTAVVDRDDLDGQAENLNAAYPHFMVGEDGEVVQYQDTDFMARADLDGNPYYISIETWDGYPKGFAGYWKHNSDVPPWNPKQIIAIIALDAWILKNHKTIPLRLARDSKPGESSKGLSWHRLGIDGDFPSAYPFHGRKAGGRRYSRAYGKACAGNRRIVQVVEVVYPALLSGALPVAGPPARPVVEVQLITAALGHYDAGTDGKWLDNVNGPATQAAVAKYQTSRGLTPDGWWGPNTENDFKENVMAGLISDIAAATATAVHDKMLNTTHGGRSEYSFWTMITRTYDDTRATRGDAAATAQVVREIAGKVGAPVDAAALAAALAPALTAPLVEAVKAAGGNIDTDAITAALRVVFADAGAA